MEEKRILRDTGQEKHGGDIFRRYLKEHMYDIAAYGGLAVTFILFLIYSGDKLAYNMAAVLQAGATYAIIALGAVFVYSMGFMDVSVGQQVGVYAILIIMITNKMGGSAPGVLAGFLAVLAIALQMRETGERGGLYYGCVGLSHKLEELGRRPGYVYYFTRSPLGDDAGAFHSSELFLSFI